jgi:hypothetical protein
MGVLVPAGMGAPLRLARALEAGQHIGMLVDQRFGRGPRVMFMGREAAANPLLAQLARRFDCPVHGARAIRLPGGRFRLELTEEIPLPRDAEGLIDINAATLVDPKGVIGTLKPAAGAGPRVVWNRRPSVGLGGRTRWPDGRVSLCPEKGQSERKTAYFNLSTRTKRV